MTKLGKIIMSLIVVVIVILGVKYWMGTDTQDYKIAPQEEVVKNEEATTLSKDASDQSLDNDLLKIEAEIKATEQSANQVDQSLNDKPVSQTE